jgi:DNA replication factor GINS
MNLDELRSVQRTERQKDSLQHLRDSFYADVAGYIEQLKDERQRAADQADDPFSAPDVQRLTDEIETAEDIVESVYERRVGKVVKLASFAAADMPAETEGLTDEELVLFEDLVGRIQTNRRTVLDTLAGKRVEDDAAAPDAADATAPDVVERDDTTADVGVDTTQSDPESHVDPAPEPGPVTEPDPATDANEGDAGGFLADAMGGGSDDEAGEDATSTPPERTGQTDETPPPPPDEPAADEAPDAPAESDQRIDREADEPERTTVRILDDVGEILGVDERSYSLDRETVVTLPAPNAEPLIERDAAERID